MIRLQPLWFGQIRRAIKNQSQANHSNHPVTLECDREHQDNYRKVIQPFIDNAPEIELEFRLRASLMFLNRIDCQFSQDTVIWLCDSLNVFDER